METAIPVTIQGKEVTAKVSGSNAHEMVQILAALYDSQEMIQGEPLLTEMIVSGKNLRVLILPKSTWTCLYPKIRIMDITNCILYNGGEEVYLLVFEEDAVSVDRMLQSIMEKQSKNRTQYGKGRNPLPARSRKNDHRFVPNWTDGREKEPCNQDGGMQSVAEKSKIQNDRFSTRDRTASAS